MNDIIHLLPDSVANQIAAGEVIQRPASVIKELVENAVDAGARRIDVLVVDAGKTSIQVIDDGKGMSETDARMSFERHATSKIKEAADLFVLRTMGFRGEALASIAAVAQVELKTRPADAELGTQLVIAGSQVERQEVVSCPAGSNFQVKNLFFNVPARRKFLKSNQTELSNILQEFERIALVNPEVTFTLSHNGTPMMTLPASTLRQRIINVFGKKLNEQLLSVEVDTTLVHLSGFVGKPEAARKKGVHQYFFVNGRYMRHPYFHKAVLEAFEQLIPVGDQVPYFLYFDVAPTNIDVNIHPTKTEIKFENEMAIWQIVVAAIRESLGRFNAVPTIDFDTEGRPDIPVFEAGMMSADAPELQVNPDFNPFRAAEKKAASGPKPATNWEPLYEGLSSKDFAMSAVSVPEETPVEEAMLYSGGKNVPEMAASHYQYKGQYILTSVKSGLMLIDQQRAHIRILYDRFKAQMASRTGTSQGLLFPEMFRLPVSDAIILDEISDDLHALGFDLSSLGGGSYSINGIPADTEGLNPADMLIRMVECAKEKGAGLEDEIQHRIAFSLARSAAIVPGQVLTQIEMESLIDDLFACETPNYTPDGKLVIAIFQQDDIDKMFR